MKIYHILIHNYKTLPQYFEVFFFFLRNIRIKIENWNINLDKNSLQTNLFVNIIILINLQLIDNYAFSIESLFLIFIFSKSRSLFVFVMLIFNRNVKSELESYTKGSVFVKR